MSADKNQAIMSQLMQVAEGIASTFSPFCEVVVHDLTEPENAILAIHNNLSGRVEGQPATELGLARISDPEYPQIIANYANQFSDGRQAKSTSIGIKDADGRYIAALCLNIDLTLFKSLQNTLAQFVGVDSDSAGKESLHPVGADAIRERIDEYAAKLATIPRSLKAEDRRLLLKELQEQGYMSFRRANEIVAAHLGVSRATIYSSAK